MTTWDKRTYKDNEERLKNTEQQWVDSKGRARQVSIDGVTGASIIIDYGHHEIHDGSTFNCFDSTDNLGAETGDHIQLLFTTADVAKRAHLFFSAYGSGEIYVTMREAYDGGGTGGVGEGINNRRRDSTKTPSVITSVTKNATAATGGTLLYEHYVGAGNKDGGVIRAADEWILAPNTKYALRVFDAAAINAYIEMMWYEHADR